MKRCIAYALVLSLSPAACEQADQRLPLSTDPAGAVTALIGGAGGVVSHPAGVALTIPAGAFRDPVRLSIRTGTQADLHGEIPGLVVPGTIYVIDAAGAALDHVAELDVRLPRDVDAAALLGLGVTVVRGGSATPMFTHSADATSRIVRARLDRLGAVAVRSTQDLLGFEPGDPAGMATGGSLPDEAGTAVGVAAAAGSGHGGVTYAVSCRGAACLDVLGVGSPDSGWLATFAGRLAAMDLAADGSLTFESGTVVGEVTVTYAAGVRTPGTVTRTLQTSVIAAGEAPTPYGTEGNVVRFGEEALYYSIGPDGSLTLWTPATAVDLTRVGGPAAAVLWARITLEAR